VEIWELQLERIILNEDPQLRSAKIVASADDTELRQVQEMTMLLGLVGMMLLQ
jgi:hypothetical protein